MKKFKLTFFVFALVGVFTLTAPALAQGPTGAQIISNMIAGVTTPQQAAQTLDSNSNLDLSQSQTLLQDIFNNNSLNPTNAGEIIDGFMSGGSLVPADLANVQTIIQNFDIQSMTQGAIDNMINGVLTNALPTDLAAAISAFDLGQLTDLADLDQLLQLPNVDTILQNMLGSGIAPDEILEMVSSIAQIGLDPSAFANLALGAITTQIASVLENALPNIYGQILANLGITTLLNSLGMSIFSLFSGSGTLNIPFVGSGNYEIFPRQPQSSPVAKSCGGQCHCSCRVPIEQNHIRIRAHVTDELIRHRTWMIDNFFRAHILPAMMLMTDQLSVVSMNSTFAFGKFFDAKMQMETERELHRLSAEAHRDYQLSPGICTIGTNVRHLAGAERKADIVQTAFNSRVSERIRKNVNSSTAQGPDSNLNSRMVNFQERYCNVNDNARGFSWLCSQTNPPASRINKDINITNTLFSKHTLEMDFADPGVALDFDGEDLFALTSHLFSPDVYPNMGSLILATPQGHARAEVFDYMNLRSVMAKRSVAADTFAAIVAERGLGVNDYPGFLKRIVADLGIPDADVEILLGFNPSYYAQRKVLTSYAFENPKFYTKLYESAANVARKDTAVKALNLMLEDDFYDRQIENEATLAIMLEVMLEDEHTRASGALRDLEPEADD